MTGDLNSFHELLLNKGISFVRYSLPGQTDAITYVSYLPESFPNLNSIGDYRKEGFVFAPFLVDEENPIWFLSADDKIEETSDLVEDFVAQLPDRYLDRDIEMESTSKQSYTKSFDTLMQALNSSELDKVILSKIVCKPRTEETLFNLYRRLSEAYPEAFTYLIHLPSGETWMGASPELLLKNDEEGIQTMALAGTQLLQNRALKEVRWEDKELEEQAYVRDYVQKVLADVSEKVNVSETYSTKAGNVVHLRTDFVLDQNFDQAQAFAMVEKLHPTPAVCGIPAKESRVLIQNNEQHKRAYYTGFLGPVNGSSISIYVNLRCMQVLDTQHILYVGGGITRDSELEKEWLETEAKAETLLSVIQTK